MRMLLLFCITAIVIFTSCQKDPCDSVVCLNGGTCNEGVCENCNLGYEGDLCSVLSRTKLIGNYLLNITCDNGYEDGPFNAAIVIDPSNELNALVNWVDPNFDSYQATVTMTSSTTFNLPPQQLCDNCAEGTSGTGALNNDGSITLNTTSANSVVCVLTFTK